jgi:hypothetical protein
MSNFRTRLLGLAAMATAFVGVSFGQVLTCTDTANNAAGPSTQPQINGALRVEGQTEQLSLLQFACTATATVAGTTTATVTITTNLPITSKVIPTGGAPVTEATLIQNGTVIAGVVTGGTAVQGTVSGTYSVTFPNITLPTSVAGTTTFFQVANIRVNASTATAVPFQTQESGTVAYTTSTTSGVTTAFAVIPSTGSSGLVVASLGPPKITGIANYTVCGGNGLNGLSFTLNINQLISGAFLGNGQPPVGEEGQYLVTASGVGTASADIINVTLGGLPSGSTVYVPQSIAVGDFTPATGVTPAGNGTSITIAGSTLSTTPGLTADVAYAVPSTGTVTIPYTVAVVSGLGAPAQSNFPVAVVVSFAANSISTPTTVTGDYYYAPSGATLTGPAAAVPTFAVGSFPAANGSVISLCQTTLLFPFVTNQLGFDTGFAIANTSVDNLGTAGKSFAVAQSGTCNLFFYGPFAPTNPVVPDPNGPLAAGSVSTFLLGNVAAGYQGYAIAVCPFNYAHGYAFISYGLTTNNGVAEGYLAEVLGGNDRNQTTATGDSGITF